MCTSERMAAMTDNDQDRPAPPREEPGAVQSDEDPGYLTQAGEAAAADGSVVPIIGGLPAVEGSAWDIGAPAEDRGAGLADEQRGQPERASDEDSSSG
jgi:hypothetical protein